MKENELNGKLTDLWSQLIVSGHILMVDLMAFIVYFSDFVHVTDFCITLR
jgi:hypothetical protein